MSILRYALINIPVDITRMQQEVAALPADAWQAHMNKYHYDGEWNVLSLRSPGGSHNPLADAMNHEEYADTALMQQCPSVEELLNHLQCEKLSARLLNLLPGAVIKEHTDKELSFENGEARLHFPVFTNPLVEFYLDNDRLQMLEGQCWYINANLAHRLVNGGDSNRIHLVIDCRVNDWLRQVFTNDLIHKTELTDADLTIRNKHTITQTIIELRKQTNSTSHELADQLEKQLIDAERSIVQPAVRNQDDVANKLTNTIIEFIRSVGITVHEGPLDEITFLPGMMIKNGALVFDRNKLLYPGDLLHEAGHIAVTPASERASMCAESISKSTHRPAEEMMTIAWSYAACMHLSIDPNIVFHEKGYRGDGASIVENFNAGRYFGTPMLYWCGMAIEPKKTEARENVFPKMIKWLRE